jgi:hypothetical protein
MSDRLTLTRAFEGAGMQSETAERIATEIYDAIHDNVATKADLTLLRADLEKTIASVEHRLITRLGGLIIAVAGVLFAALRYLPPPH